jgi:hypothetical protein
MLRARPKLCGVAAVIAIQERLPDSWGFADLERKSRTLRSEPTALSERLGRADLLRASNPRLSAGRNG